MRCPRSVPLRSGRTVIGRSPAPSSKPIENVPTEDCRSASPSAPPDRARYGGDFGGIWDCGGRESKNDSRRGARGTKKQAVKGRRGYTVLESLFVLDWPSRTRTERWPHAHHVHVIQTFPPSCFSLDGTTDFWHYKIRIVGLMVPSSLSSLLRIQHALLHLRPPYRLPLSSWLWMSPSTAVSPSPDSPQPTSRAASAPYQQGTSATLMAPRTVTTLSRPT